MDHSFSPDKLSWDLSQQNGKRQRIYNMVKQTKDTYFRAAKNSVKNYYSNDMSPAEARALEFQLHPPRILSYPSYARKVSTGTYVTQLRGLVYSTGQKSKRNSLLLSICRQFLRSDPPPNVEQNLESLQNDSNMSLESNSTDSAASSIRSSDQSSTMEALVPLSPEQVLKQRITGFMNKNLGNLRIQTTVFNEKNEKVDVELLSDNSGSFDISMESNFKPYGAEVKCLETGLVQTCPIFFVEDRGVGLISDVDDTIKHTGVVGDKRSIFLNVFVSAFEEWEVKDMPLWYKTLRDSRNVDFFYVSNAPAQIFPILSEYIGNNYPMGPIFLKQYSGNLLSSIMTSSAQRKLSSITKICTDFPNKKFILVGDSGEQDLEAYVSTACNFPDQIIGIYIRCCKNSMSDEPENDVKVMNSLNELIKRQCSNIVGKEPFPDLIQFDSDNSDLEPMYNRTVQKTRYRRPPPAVPTHKPTLSTAQQKEIEDSKLQTNKPQLPPRRPQHMKMRSMDSAVYSIPSSQNDYGTYSEFFDKKAENWNERVTVALSRLQSSNINTRIMFFNDPIACLEDSINKIDSLS